MVAVAVQVSLLQGGRRARASPQSESGSASGSDTEAGRVRMSPMGAIWGREGKAVCLQCTPRRCCPW